MIIKITPKENLVSGIWFSRKMLKVTGIKKNWCIAIIYGESPFLQGTTISFQSNQQIITSRILDFNEWEFGPRIEFPSNE